MKRLLKSLALLLFSSNLYAACGLEGTFEIGADWLYWKPFQDNLEFGALVNGTSNGDLTIVSDPLRPDFKADSGFRIFASYACRSSPWKILASYTRLFSDTRGQVSVDPATIDDDFIVLNSQGFPIFDIFTSNGINFFSLASSWSSTVNYFDLDIGRTFCCPCIQITPHMGLRGMWLKQKLNLEGSALAGVFNSRFHQKFDGYGLEGGLNTCLPLVCGFSLSGYVNLSLLYARIEVDEIVQLASESLTTIQGEDTVHHLSPVFDAFIGLNYCLALQCLSLQAHVGWEQHIIMNSNHFDIFNYADLTLQGLTLGGSIAF